MNRMVFWTVVLLTLAVLTGIPGWWPISCFLVGAWLCTMAQRHFDELGATKTVTAIERRADDQHRAWLGGDYLTGMYGDYPPHKMFQPPELAARNARVDQPPRALSDRQPFDGEAMAARPLMQRVLWADERLQRLRSLGKKSPQEMSTILATERWLTKVADAIGMDREGLVILAREEIAQPLSFSQERIKHARNRTEAKARARRRARDRVGMMTEDE